MYKFVINDFEGPLDLLLHLIKESNINITDISIEEITKQYLNFIEEMENMNLDIASEYLVMAAELIEMKSKVYLPKKEKEEDDYEEDPREQLINRLLEYQRYKDTVDSFRELEKERKEIYTIPINTLNDIEKETKVNELPIEALTEAFNNLLKRKQQEKPLVTRITKKEYSISVRNNEIKQILKKRKKVEFEELFEIVTKSYVVITFLSILDLARKQEISIEQDKNFSKIYLSYKESKS